MPNTQQDQLKLTALLFQIKITTSLKTKPVTVLLCSFSSFEPNPERIRYSVCVSMYGAELLITPWEHFLV